MKRVMLVVSNKIPFKWEVTFKIEPSLSKSETINGLNFELIDNETLVKVRFETEAYDEILPDASEECEYAQTTKTNKFKPLIRELLLHKLVYQRLMEPLSIEVKSGPVLLNEADLKKAGYIFSLRVITKCDTVRRIIDVGDSLAESEMFWQNGFKNKAAGHQDDVERIADWYLRGESEYDLLNKFILYWIGFNGLYGLVALIDGKEKLTDADKIEYTLNSLLNVDASSIVTATSGALSALENYNIMADRGNTNWSEKLKDEREKPNSCALNVLLVAMRCVYGVRKQLFHEAPKTNDILDRVRNSIKVLELVAPACLKNFVNY